MRIDFSRELVDFEGQPIKETARPDSKNVTLRKICVNALLGEIPNEHAEGSEKLRRYQLAQKINSGTMDISLEDAALIKKLVGYGFNTIVVGQVYEILEGKEVKKEEPKTEGQ